MGEERPGQGAGGPDAPTAPPSAPAGAPSERSGDHPPESDGAGALLQWMAAQEPTVHQTNRPPAARRRAPASQVSPIQGGTIATGASFHHVRRNNGDSGAAGGHPTGYGASATSSGGSSPLSDDNAAAAAAEARRREQWRQLQALGALPPTINRVKSSNVSSASAFVEKVGLEEELEAARAERAALSAHGAVLVRLLAIKNAEVRALGPPGASSASEATAAAAPEVSASDRRGDTLRALLDSDALDDNTKEQLQHAAALCDAGSPEGDAAAAQQRAARAAAARLSPDQIQRLQVAYRQMRRRMRAATAQSNVESTGLGRQLGSLDAPTPQRPPVPANNERDAGSVRPWHEKAESHLSCTTLAARAASASRETLAAAAEFEFQFFEIMGPQILALVHIEFAPHPVDCVAVSNEILSAAGASS